ncbi:Maf/Ham1 [Zopfia rhizophila CBS 207.26]|uniref:inosine/xanthosine triphosphatase n=1 Tax=Zopfia rhizophila CBS 207.26 TaxID=1314779 RepID=A0A6A6DCP7_9PEZI|nr:Maf/Ham1 [Zopfia rhizophila CBS 207.26]
MNSQAPPQTIIVASQNPVKIGAALESFLRMFPNPIYTVRGVSVASGVPDQPFSDDETLCGALNRVQNARALEPDADYWVGIEGGVDTHAGSLQSFAWVVIVGKGGRTGKARTATYYLPEETSRLVREGMELGHADDLVFGRSNSKQHNGSVGLLTDDVVDRSAYYVQAVILALIPFKNANLTF